MHIMVLTSIVLIVKQYLAPLPTSAVAGNNVTMSLENAFGNDDASTLGTTYSAGDKTIVIK